MAIARNRTKRNHGIIGGHSPLAVGPGQAGMNTGNIMIPFAHNGIKASLLRDIKNGGSASQPQQVADQFTDFISRAKQSIHIAIYDFRLQAEPDIEKQVIGMLKKMANQGIDVRIVYDHTKPNAPTVDPFLAVGADPAPKGTHEAMQQLEATSNIKVKAIELQPILGSHLMHSKYIIRDVHSSDATILMGSANFTIDAWSYQENNILEIASPSLASYYETDWGELWTTGNIKGTGVNDDGTEDVSGTEIDVAFAPGEGPTIDAHIASLISSAKSRVKIASMVITSTKILGALQDMIEAKKVKNLGGIYDGPQMGTTRSNWGKHGSPNEALFDSVVKGMGLIAKRSNPYNSKSNKPHDFMHDKVAVIDDTVVTGSFNFSSNATKNAENNLVIHDAAMADKYDEYIDEIVKHYSVD